MKKVIACMIALSILGCARPILRHPAFSTVKKLAIVSIYTNHDIYNVKEAESNPGLLAGLKKAIHGEAGLEDANVQLTTAALATYSKELGKLSNWDVVDSSVLIADETYMAFVSETMAGGALAAFATAGFVTPPGMALVPFESIAGKANTKTYGDDPTAAVKARLAQLAADLGVDGVAVIDVDCAYEKGAFSGMSGTGLLSGIRGKATPSVSSAMMVITRDGSIAVQTKHVQHGGGKRHSAGKAPMLLKSKVDLTGEKGAESIMVFDSAFLLNADALKIAIQEELAGG